jgi:cutinase
MDKVVAIVVFGDPDRGTPFPGPLNATAKTFCHEGDLICEGTAIVLPTHFDYSDDASAAAAFVKERLSKQHE